MDNIKYSYVFNRKKQLNKEGKALIQLRIYLNGANYYLSTGIYVAPNEWNESEKVVKKHENKNAINQKLSAFVHTLESAEIEQKRKGKPVTFEYLKSIAENKQSEIFIAFCEKEIGLQTLKEATHNNHKATFEKIKSYEMEKNTKLCFSDINISFLESFEKWCKNTGLATNSIARHLQVIKAYYNRAINQELIDVRFYPFRKYKIRKEKTSIEYLDKNELQALESVDISTISETTKIVLDTFLFSCYTGLRFADIQALKKEAIKVEKGKTYLVLKTSKTAKATKLPLSVLFGGKALQLIEKYKNEPIKVFPRLTNDIANRHLKRIATAVQIEKRLHFHVARHTFATILLNEKVNIVSVQTLLGHTDLKTTQIYAKLSDDSLEKELLEKT